MNTQVDVVLGAAIPTYIDFTFFVELVLFLLFLWILNAILYKPLLTIFRERAERVEAGLRAAEEAQRAAEETQRRVQEELERSRVEARDLIASAGKAAEEQRQQALAQARSESDAIVAAARASIQQEREEAVKELRRSAGSVAIIAASKIVGSSLDTPANRELADRTMAEMGGK